MHAKMGWDGGPTRGTLMLEVPAFVTINNDQWKEETYGTITSSTAACDIGNLKWQLELRKEGNGAANYSLYIKCNKNCTEHFWFCTAKFAIYSTVEEDGVETEIVATDPMHAFYGNSALLIADAIDLKNTKWIIVDVDLLRVQDKMFALDTNIEIKMTNGAKLVAANKQGLASVSTYFNNLFSAQWKENGQNEFVLHEEDDPNFDIDTFQLMIYAALSLSWMVSQLLELFREGSRMIDILKLSFKYDIPPLVEYCQNQLIIDPKTYAAQMGMLELAEQMNLTKLMDHCLVNFDPLEFMADIGQSIEIRSRLEKGLQEKLDRMLKECAEKMEYKKGNRAYQYKMPTSDNYNSAEEERILGSISKAQRFDIIEKTWLSDVQNKIWFQNKFLEEKESKENEGMSLNLKDKMMQKQSTSAYNPEEDEDEDEE